MYRTKDKSFTHYWTDAAGPVLQDIVQALIQHWAMSSFARIVRGTQYSLSNVGGWSKIEVSFPVSSQSILKRFS